MIREGRLGGVMYLKTNVTSLAAVKDMNAAFRAASPDLPPLIALDQEGGLVERLTKDVGFTEIAAAGDIAASMNATEAEAVYLRMATALADLGFDLNFGPVVDLDLNPTEPPIGAYRRSFGTDPAKVVAYAKAFVDAHRQAGVPDVAQAFSGTRLGRQRQSRGICRHHADLSRHRTRTVQNR